MGITSPSITSINGSYRPLRIEYSKHTSGNGAGDDPATVSAIDFLYEDREDVHGDPADVIAIYPGGQLVQEDKRLSGIETRVGTETVARYSFDYEVDAGTGRTRLTTVHRCNGAGTECARPLTFEWTTQGILPFAGRQTWLTVNGSRAGWKDTQVDMDGDGRLDHVVHYIGGASVQVRVFRNNGVGGFDAGVTWHSATTGSWSGWTQEFIDVNADGLPDHVRRYANHNGAGVYVGYNTGSGFTNYQTVSSVTDNRTGWTQEIRDIDGDGRADHVLHIADSSQSRIWVALNKADPPATTTFQPGTFWHSDYNSWGSPWVQELRDMNGDGRPDHIRRYKTGTQANVYVGYNNGGDFANYDTVSSIAGNFTPWTQDIIDMNGDGRGDHVLHIINQHYSLVFVSLNRAEGFASPFYYHVDYNNWGSSGVWKQQLQDVNGDGLPDHIRRYTTTASANVQLGLNNGIKMVGHTTVSSFSMNASLYTQQLLDVTGDGLAEHVLTYTGSGGLRAFVGPNPQKLPNRIETITSSQGAVTTLTYEGTGEPGVHTRDASADYPNADHPYVASSSPLPVVTSVSATDGIGGTQSTEYTYLHGRLHLLGRGFLGFGAMIATVDQSSEHPGTVLQTTTEYAQTFPYIGQVAASTAIINDNGTVSTLTESENTWTAMEFDPDASPGTHDETFLPVVDVALAKNYEFTDGTNTPVTTITTESGQLLGPDGFDSYGNPTYIKVTTDGAGASYTKITENTYHNDDANWLLGRLTCAASPPRCPTPLSGAARRSPKPAPRGSSTTPPPGS